MSSLDYLCFEMLVFLMFFMSSNLSFARFVFKLVLFYFAMFLFKLVFFLSFATYLFKLVLCFYLLQYCHKMAFSAVCLPAPTSKSCFIKSGKLLQGCLRDIVTVTNLEKLILAFYENKGNCDLSILTSSQASKLR